MENKFLKKLPTCIPLDICFHIYGGNYRACYCPCNEAALTPWHNVNDLLIHLSGCKIQPYQPGKLIHHLIISRKTKQGGISEIYHYISYTYMNELFKTWHGPRLSHKAFYPSKTNLYKEACMRDKTIFSDFNAKLSSRNIRQSRVSALSMILDSADISSIRKDTKSAASEKLRPPSDESNTMESGHMTMLNDDINHDQPVVNVDANHTPSVDEDTSTANKEITIAESSKKYYKTK